MFIVFKNIILYINFFLEVSYSINTKIPSQRNSFSNLYDLACKVN